MTDERVGDLGRAGTQFQDLEAAALLDHELAIGALTDKFADRLPQGDAMAQRVRLGGVDRVIFK